MQLKRGAGECPQWVESRPSLPKMWEADKGEAPPSIRKDGLPNDNGRTIQQAAFTLQTCGESSMDLNDLFYQQQLERSRADAAPSDEARDFHEGLARRYEEQIVAARKPDAGAGSLFQWVSSRSEIVKDPKVNSPMAVAITARWLGAD